jgi:NADPH:quinone reductase-like Zn-dependent oxidoreductase
VETREAFMKAMVATGYGDLEKLEMRQLPDPAIGNGQVRVRIAAASINPIDWKLLSGHARDRRELTFPAVLGRDASGEVLEVGKGVENLKVGDAVLGLTWGTYAEQVVSEESDWAKAPPGLDLKDAAAIPLVGLTGAQLIERLSLQKGHRILVTGAVGGVGRSAVYTAKKSGAAVFAGVRRTQKAEAQGLGAEGVVAIDDDGEIAKLPQFDFMADTVGGPTLAKLLGYLKADGTLGSVLGEPPAAKERGVKVVAIRTQPDSRLLGALAVGVAQGKLVIPVSRRFPLSQGREAMGLARGGGLSKVLLLP